MSRDPLEGLRPPDMPARAGVSAGGERPAWLPAVAIGFGIFCAVVAGAVLYFVSRPVVPTRPVQTDTPAPSPTPLTTSPSPAATAASHG
jgi:hypothetical protein